MALTTVEIIAILWAEPETNSRLPAGLNGQAARSATTWPARSGHRGEPRSWRSTWALPVALTSERMARTAEVSLEMGAGAGFTSELDSRPHRRNRKAAPIVVLVGPTRVVRPTA
jgi:hypothetical protein